MPVIDASKSRDMNTSDLSAIGMLPETEHLTGNALANANLARHGSHGVIRLLDYVEIARAGHFLSAARARVVHRHSATAVLDGSWGQPAMSLTTDVAIGLARAWIRDNGFDRVLLPGEPENFAHMERSTTVFSIPASTWSELITLVSNLGLDVTQWNRNSDCDLSETLQVRDQSTEQEEEP